MTETPKICVQCLADYNAGSLHFTWIDADQDEDSIWEEIYELLRTSRHPNVKVDCPECEGEAVFHRIKAGAPEGSEAEEIPCPECKGTGKVDSAEEWEIVDSSAFGGFCEEAENSVEDAVRAAKLMDEYGSAATAAASHFVGLDEIEKALKHQHLGVYDSVADYVQELEEGSYTLPDHLKGYIDWKSYAENEFPNIVAVRVITDQRLYTSELHLFDTESEG
jgi:antirestriction protein